MTMFEFLLYESPDSWVLLDSRRTGDRPRDRRGRPRDGGAGGRGDDAARLAPIQTLAAPLRTRGVGGKADMAVVEADLPEPTVARRRRRIGRRAVLTVTAIAAGAALLAATPRQGTPLGRRHCRLTAWLSPARRTHQSR